MLELPPASVHVKRDLTARERGTIAVALRMLTHHVETPQLENERAELLGDDGLLTDAEIEWLVLDLMHARKVKVCRSKRAQA